MTMGQPFPGVWLPQHVDATVGLMLATGGIDAQYAIDYHDYKLADVSTRVRIGGDR